MTKLESSPMSGLLEDLVEEILNRVPVTSLNRLRSTCKQWNALFNDHRFMKKHLDKAPKHLMLKYEWVSSLSVNLRGLHDNIDPSIEVEGEVSLTDLHYNSEKFDVSEVFHCDGLLLCKTNMRTGLVVWNPCTGQTRWIQTKRVNYRYDTYALGYENIKSCNNYKIMRFLDYETFELEIYEFNSNSWRVLDSVIPDFVIQVDGVSLKGNTYWIAADKLDEFVNEFLISFDFTRERFGPRVALPSKGFGDRDFKALSSVREERLLVLFEDEDTSTMEIWMTNNIIDQTKAMTWTNFLKIDLNTIQFCNNVSFFIQEEEEKKVAVCFDEIFEFEGDELSNIVYIIGENGLRKVNIGKGSLFPRMFSYVPSLVRLVL